jgi:hypothetical protein
LDGFAYSIEAIRTFSLFQPIHFSGDRMKTLLQHLFPRALVRPAIALALAGAIALPALARDDARYIYTLDNAVTDNKS